MLYETLADSGLLTKTIAELQNNNFTAEVVETAAEALEKIKQIIPAGASVMNGASVSLQQIGFVDYLKSGNHGWNNLHQGILDETDPEKQALLRAQSVLSDYYLGSVHAVSATGELLFASNTGSQLPHLAFTSPNVILVVGTHKITQGLADAFHRINSYVVPKEDVRAKEAYGSGTMHAKTLILHKENPYMKRNVHIIFVNEILGY